MRRADRLVRMVQFLRSRSRAVTANQIADEFEICTRTVYRDINDLMNSGAPIWGEAGVGYIMDKRYYLPPITFDPDELEALGLGISVVRQWTDDKFAQKAQSALEKIQAVLPANLQGDLEQLTTYSRPSEAQLPWTIDFSQLRDAIRKRRKISVSYQDENDTQTTRILRPLALVFFGPIWILASWCELRQDFRNFRIDRIQNLMVSDEAFKDEPDKNLTAYHAQDAVC